MKGKNTVFSFQRVSSATEEQLRRHINANPALREHVATECGTAAFWLADIPGYQYLVAQTAEHANWDNNGQGYSFWVRMQRNVETSDWVCGYGPITDAHQRGLIFDPVLLKVAQEIQEAAVSSLLKEVVDDIFSELFTRAVLGSINDDALSHLRDAQPGEVIEIPGMGFGIRIDGNASEEEQMDATRRLFAAADEELPENFDLPDFLRHNRGKDKPTLH